MKYLFALPIVFFLIACNGASKNDPEETIVETVPVTVTLSPQQKAVQDAIIGIEKKDIESAGNIVTAIHVEGMEIIKFSKKDYFITELESQETEFKKYMQYLDKISKTKNNMSDHLNREESQRKHNAVMGYLRSAIKTASVKQDIYKVVYYLKADTKSVRYDQLKTTYLDSTYNKIVADYGFLK